MTGPQGLRTSRPVEPRHGAPLAECKAFIRNISLFGPLIECEATLAVGLSVKLERENLRVNGAIAWVKQRTYRMKFGSAAEPGAWLGDETKQGNHQSKVTFTEAVDSEVIVRRIAEEMEYAVRLIQNSYRVFRPTL